MTTPTTQNASASPSSGGSQDSTSRDSASQLVTEQGATTIADAVVQKIAGLAASEISGVYALGGGTARAFGALRERIPGASASAGQGVSVEVGERQTAVDLELVVEYGVSIVDLARAARRNVIAAIERMTGLEVVEVNIAVNDMHLPDEETDTEREQTTRLQ
ncbi:putative alkaline shock family protein YloU [Prauserella shujinwangii]|uniref:Putative alkaline shock family protein YloU n=1 Tax=Prauserella shujinwangii TaxID=1453103 RepID=A0A2T0M0C3_9PSEU|nr:Asp23/Gls24 family envelope stress response protein [Prauserella shujinwangii]PRX50039.1 putative alkaline shock family protein YloU [Prauserella shujinwangii]